MRLGAGTIAAFDILKAELKRALLLPPFPTHFDPFRDSHAADIYLYHDASIAGRKLSALLCGFNDLRSVAHTIGEAARKGSRATMSFTLNDLRAEPIARTLLILHALMHSTLDRPTLARFIGQLWFSEHVETAALAYWIEQMRTCLESTGSRLTRGFASPTTRRSKAFGLAG
ncbi:hypothetical protein H9P43_009097 [Blastocladiella emersonii ATCC 22665]|nr:hypothetical protein H9P43_009097 [Blastocladiella emersonii ATCC 22665]